MDKFYSVKYALTKGVTEVYGEEKHVDGSTYLSVRNERGVFEILFESQYAKTKGEAVYRAMKKRDKKIESLRAQILRLEKIIF